jgi:hypothetical protein
MVRLARKTNWMSFYDLLCSVWPKIVNFWRNVRISECTPTNIAEKLGAETLQPQYWYGEISLYNFEKQKNYLLHKLRFDVKMRYQSLAFSLCSWAYNLWFLCIASFEYKNWIRCFERYIVICFWCFMWLQQNRMWSTCNRHQIDYLWSHTIKEKSASQISRIEQRLLFFHFFLFRPLLILCSINTNNCRDGVGLQKNVNGVHLKISYHFFFFFFYYFHQIKTISKECVLSFLCMKMMILPETKCII